MTKKIILSVFILSFLSSCATIENSIGGNKFNTPPEFNQKIILQVGDDYKAFQAVQSGYDVGDLQSFHTQHTFPVVVEDAFKELFGKVELLENKPKPGIEMELPDVPAIFEVRMLDLSNDIYFEAADTYRSEITVAVAMKSPRDVIFWQQAFRGDGYVKVDNQFSTGLGPEGAVVDAVRDVLAQIQKAILASPEVRNQMKYYQDSNQARQQTEMSL